MKKLFWIIIAAVLAFSLSGCGRQEVDYNVGTEEDGNAADDDAMAATLKEALGVDEDEWITDIASTDGKFSNLIRAEVSVPDAVFMSVLKLEKKVITAEDKKRIVEGLFDEDTIYAESEEDMPEWYLDFLLSEDAETAEWASEDVYESFLKQRESAEALKDDAPGVGIKTADYTEDLYFGDISGIHYWLQFTENGFFCYANDCTDLAENAPIQEGTLYYEMSNADIFEVTCALPAGYTANLTSTSKQDMQSRAAGIIAACGLDAYAVNDTYSLFWHGYNETESYDWEDGYCFLYTRNVNGESVDYTNYDNIRYNRSDSIIIDSDGTAVHTSFDGLLSDDNAGEEYITVQINEQGIVEITAPCLYEVKESTEKQAALISYAEVKEAIQSSLEADSDPYGLYEYSAETSFATKNTYNRLELIYAYLPEEESSYTLLPVWRLSCWDITGHISQMLCIDATDGSYVDILQ